MQGSNPCWAALGAALVVIATMSAGCAQTPPYYPPPPPPVVAPAAPIASPASDIAACLCLRRDIDALGANMGAKRHAYDDVRGELARMDARLERERSSLDVNNPDAVARFRQLLGERDTMFHRSTGAIASDLSGVTARYNDRVNQYNARCSNRPQDPALVAQVQTTLACPAPY